MKSVPMDTWGTLTFGQYSGSKVIVHKAETDGWDIALFPPSPSTDVWYQWAGNESELEMVFGHVDAEVDVPEWISAGVFEGVIWNGQPPERESLERGG